MKDRESWLSATMVELSDTLVSDYDLTELLDTLAQRCEELLEATAVGVVITDQHGTLHAMSSSSERMRVLELLELQCGGGPWLDCIRRGAPVEATLLDDAARARWPSFHAAAVQAGYRQVLALPMRLRDTTIGAVSVVLDDHRPVPAADLRLAQALADIATIGILQERVSRESVAVSRQLQGALNSRIAIEQAKGMLAQHHRISVDEAFELLRDYARSHNLRLTDVARATASRQFALDQFSPVGHRSACRHPEGASGADSPRTAALRRPRRTMG